MGICKSWTLDSGLDYGWTGLWTGLGLDFVLVLPLIAAYSSEMLVPSRKLTASHHCGIEEAAKLEAMTSSTISFRT